MAHRRRCVVHCWDRSARRNRVRPHDLPHSFCTSPHHPREALSDRAGRAHTQQLRDKDRTTTRGPVKIVDYDTPSGPNHGGPDTIDSRLDSSGAVRTRTPESLRGFRTLWVPQSPFLDPARSPLRTGSGSEQIGLWPTEIVRPRRVIRAASQLPVRYFYSTLPIFRCFV